MANNLTTRNKEVRLTVCAICFERLVTELIQAEIMFERKPYPATLETEGECDKCRRPNVPVVQVGYTVIENIQRPWHIDFL